MFRKNNGAIEGGAIKWSLNAPIFKDTFFEENNATYGNDRAAYPLMMKMKILDRCKCYFFFCGFDLVCFTIRIFFFLFNSYIKLVNETILYDSSQNKDLIYKYDAQPSGEKLLFLIHIELVDFYGQIVTIHEEEY